MKNTLSAKVWFVIVFLALFAVGFWLARQRFVWNDEIYTQLSTVEGRSYTDLILGRIKEGSVSPLFYLMQKVLGITLHYTSPMEWHTDMGFDHFPSRIVLRLNSIFFMSLAVAAIFYFFYRFYSSPAGVYSLLVALSSYMVWAFWAEGRPYALWFFLTTMQSLFYLYLVREGKKSQAAWSSLAAIHLLLSLASVFSIVQILIVSFLLWFFVKKSPRRYILPMLIPSMICLYYYLQSPQYRFWFADSPGELISANIPKDRFVLIFLFIIFALLYFYQRKKNVQIIKTDLMQEGIVYLSFLGLLLAATGAIMLKFKLGESASHEGFQVSSRYFIYLAPAGIVAATLFSIGMWKALQGRRGLQALLAVVIVFLLVIRLQRTFDLVKGYYHF